MQTILRIIERAGGWNSGLFLKIEHAPYMALTIEAIEAGATGLQPSLSPITANSMATSCAIPRCVSSFATANLAAHYYRNDYVGVEQWSRNIVGGQYVQLANLHAPHQRFALYGLAVVLAPAVGPLVGG